MQATNTQRKGERERVSESLQRNPLSALLILMQQPLRLRLFLSLFFLSRNPLTSIRSEYERERERDLPSLAYPHPPPPLPLDPCLPVTCLAWIQRMSGGGGSRRREGE